MYPWRSYAQHDLFSLSKSGNPPGNLTNCWIFHLSPTSGVSHVIRYQAFHISAQDVQPDDVNMSYSNTWIKHVSSFVGPGTSCYSYTYPEYLTHPGPEIFSKC